MTVSKRILFAYSSSFATLSENNRLVNKNNGISCSRAVTGHSPRRADILSALDAPQRLPDSDAHWTPQADRMSTRRSFGRDGGGSARIRPCNRIHPVRARKWFPFPSSWLHVLRRNDLCLLTAETPNPRTEGCGCPCCCSASSWALSCPASGTGSSTSTTPLTPRRTLMCGKG